MTSSLSSSSTIDWYGSYVLPTYGRFPICLDRGLGCHVWDEDGVEYLDFGAGIAVCSIGHCHPRLVQAISEQAARLIHTSNLYYTEPQARLAKRLVEYVDHPGRVFFCNSGGEANEGLIKLSRKYGSVTAGERYEIITFNGSFHGRTMAGISATGQDKVKHGFEPLLPGFRHIPLNDPTALMEAINEKTIAILVEPVQGEGGIHATTADFLRLLRRVCDEYDLLLCFDEVQCGLGRTGAWCGWKSVVPIDLMPDAVSWAKGIAGGFPMGAFWVKSRPFSFASDGSEGNLSELLGPGTHGTTFGGTPLACAAAHAVFDVIEEEGLLQNALEMGDYARQSIKALHSPLIREVRGLGLMIGIELATDLLARLEPGSNRTASQIMVGLLHQERLLVIPAGANVLRWLPPLNVTRQDIDLAITKLAAALQAAEHASS